MKKKDDNGKKPKLKKLVNFKKPFLVTVLTRSNVASIHGDVQVKQEIIQIHTVDQLLTLATAAAKGECVIAPSLAIQLFLVAMHEVGAVK